LILNKISFAFLGQKNLHFCVSICWKWLGLCVYLEKSKKRAFQSIFQSSNQSLHQIPSS
jgi:hypothetical protein